MKRIFTLFSICIMVLFFSSAADAQNVIFSEDFENGMPANFTLIDNDMGIINTALAGLFTDAWIVNTDEGDNSAGSTSWNTPVVQCDDWMITPGINIGGNAILKWDAQAQDPSYPDGYEVRISTVGPTITDCLANPPLFSIAAENATYTSRSVDLAAAGYTNTTVYIAFRNNSTDQFIIYVDDIAVEEPFADDAGASLLINPINTGCKLTATETVEIEVFNYGVNDITTIDLYYSIDEGTPVMETTTFSPAIPSQGSATYSFTTPADLSTDPFYQLDAWTSLAGDGGAANDSTFEFVGSINAHDIAADGAYFTSYELTSPTDTAGWAWVFDDADGDGITWDIFTGLANDGTFSIIADDGGNTPDDWAISTCIDLVGGTAYVVRFQHRTGTFTDGTPIREDFTIAYGTAANAAAMTNMIVSDTISTGAYEPYNASFTPVASGTYHIGLNRNTETTAGLGSPFIWIVDEFEVDVLAAPTASFNATVNAQDSSVTITNNSSGDPDSYMWDFGDGMGTSTDMDPGNYQYADSGTYEICLIVTNSAGADTTCQTVTIDAILPPVAGFTYILNDNILSVTDASTGTISSWVWDWGDGTTNGLGIIPGNHTYSDTGTYNVCLTVSNSAGMNMSCQMVTVSTITGINEIDRALNNAVSVYPNPVENMVNIRFGLTSTEDVQIRIYDELGKQIHVASMNDVLNNEFNFNMSTYANGVYYIDIQTPSATATKKFVVAK